MARLIPTFAMLSKVAVPILSLLPRFVDLIHDGFSFLLLFISLYLMEVPYMCKQSYFYVYKTGFAVLGANYQIRVDTYFALGECVVHVPQKMGIFGASKQAADLSNLYRKWVGNVHKAQ
jgi:hypothetical protein